MRNSIDSKISFLVLGLLIGLGAGYLITQRNAVRLIDGMNDEINLLKEEHDSQFNGLNNTLSNIETEFFEIGRQMEEYMEIFENAETLRRFYEDRVNGLEDKIDDLIVLNKNMYEEIQYLDAFINEHSISVIPAGRSNYQILQLTNNDVDDRSVRISNDLIVWEQIVNDKGRIMAYDGETIFPLSDHSVNAEAPSIWRDQVVWQGWLAESRTEIFYYNGTHTIQITNDNIHPKYPRVHNGQIVWVVDDGHDDEIYFYDGNEIIQLTDNDRQDFHPDIEDGKIVWTGQDGNLFEVYYSDGESIFQLTDNDIHEVSPTIKDGIIVWSGGGNIYKYNGSVVQITNDKYNNQGAKTDNGQIIWYSNINGLQIMMHNGTEIIQLSNSSYYNQDARISNGHVVWLGLIDDISGMHSDIFVYDGSSITRLTTDSSMTSSYDISNGRVVYVREIDDDDEIFLAKPK